MDKTMMLNLCSVSFFTLFLLLIVYIKYDVICHKKLKNVSIGTGSKEGLKKNEG